MIAIEIHDLESQIREALRQARERGEMVDILEDGAVVARLMPIPVLLPKRSDEEVLADMERLAVEIGAHWPEGVSALDAIHDVRREL